MQYLVSDSLFFGIYDIRTNIVFNGIKATCLYRLYQSYSLLVELDR